MRAPRWLWAAAWLLAVLAGKCRAQVEVGDGPPVTFCRGSVPVSRIPAGLTGRELVNVAAHEWAHRQALRDDCRGRLAHFAWNVNARALEEVRAACVGYQAAGLDAAEVERRLAKLRAALLSLGAHPDFVRSRSC